MTTYTSLLRYTDQGRRNLSQSPKRASEFKAEAERGGVTVVGQYWTAGQYDGLLILQAEDERKILRILGQLTAAGNVRLCSLRTFDAAEFSAIVAGAS